MEVRGYEGREAILVVWGELTNGPLLCTEEGYRRRMSGEEAPVIGFPISDIEGPHDGAQSAKAT